MHENPPDPLGKCMFLLTTDTITLLLYTCPNCKTKATIEEGFFSISSEFQDNTVVIKQKKGSTCKNIQSGGGFISVFFFKCLEAKIKMTNLLWG